jgi:uncharacterized Rmd1/YagE family protein
MECLSFCIANSIDLTKLDTHFKSNLPNYISTKLRDVVKLTTCDSQRYLLFIFKNGTVVSWGVKRHRINRFLELIKPFADKLIAFDLHDEFSYSLGEKNSIEPHDFFEVDCLIIDEDSDDLKLSFSYGFSQSVKLQYFETTVDYLIDKYTPMIQGLSAKGNMPLTRNKIRQIIGEILGAKSEMNLISNFLYHPKYFWQHPTLEIYYSMLEKYLHIQRRINTMNHRLDTLNEIFDMFNKYLENKHAHNLEIIIIVLIMVEIIVASMSIHF